MAALAQDYAPLSDMRASSQLPDEQPRKTCCAASGSKRAPTRRCRQCRRQCLRRRCERRHTHESTQPSADPDSRPERAADWAAVGMPRPHESAVLHVLRRGHLHRRHRPKLQGTLHAALGLSQKAHARIVAHRPGAACAPRRGVVAVLTAADIPGINDCGPIIHDDPILADGLVQYVGQPLFIVVADTPRQCPPRRARRRRSTTKNCRPS